jgi:peptidoglycan/xylan/chitin deacetylase (PgdA/CDA1 family)
MNEDVTPAPLTSPADTTPASRRGVSVIVPAHNAAATLEATLNSVVDQTHALWEVLLVDDGSTDGTRAIAEHWARKDERFRVLHQERSGVSAARNRGLREARCQFVLFLDADDRIAPTHLDRMIGKLAADSTLAAVHCGSLHVLPSGATGRPRLGSDEADLFRYFAFQCVFDIHACVLCRDLAVAVGGFDPALTTCEDWDFFQRIARTGARFGRVPEVLAFYHVRPGSASQNSRCCVTDARVVVNRGHGPDPRMRIAAESHAEGEIPTYRDLAFYYTLTAFAAQDIGAGRDGLDLLDADLPPAPDLSAVAIADTILELLPMAGNRLEEDWLILWSQVSAPLAAFLTKLEAQAGAPAVAFATLRYLEKKILLADPGDVSLVLGSTYRVNVELARKIRDVFLPPEADRVICRLTLKGEPIGAVELPGAGVVTGRRIAEAALEGRGRLVLGRALTPGRGLRLGLRSAHGLLRSRTLGLLYSLLAAKPNEKLAAVRRLKHEAAGVVKANLSRILATRPGLAARQADRRWHEHLEAMAASGRAQVRGRLGTARARIKPVAGEPARSPKSTPANLVAERACSVPILLYHRIATDGPAALERYRLSPDIFDLQMTALHRAGYYTISLGDWVTAMVRLEPLPGKPAILTFDDGYRDFLSAAVPVLRAHGFSATVFLVAERIGGSADWDAAYGETAPLLSWEEVRALRETGIEFGCHSLVHRPMTGMHLKELAEDAVRARAILEEGLAAPVTTLAYPHGAVNDFVRGVIADLDFRAAVSCEPGISQFGDDLLRLRRIEITGGCTSEQLLALIDRTSEKA